MFPSTSSQETLRFSGKKNYCFPRDQSLGVNYRMHGKLCKIFFSQYKKVNPFNFHMLLDANGTKLMQVVETIPSHGFVQSGVNVNFAHLQLKGRGLQN